MTDVSSLTRIANMMGPIGSQESCQCLPLAMLSRQLVIFSLSLKKKHIKLSTNLPCKNSKAEIMFRGVPTGLCSEGLMHSIWHGLKNYKKTLCNAKKFLIKANMDCYHLPLPVMNEYFKQVTPPKTISGLESGNYYFNKLTEFKKNGCKIQSSRQRG
jgi:hypothetical protein